MSYVYEGNTPHPVCPSEITLSLIDPQDLKAVDRLINGLQNSFAPSIYESFGPSHEKVPHTATLMTLLADPATKAYDVYYKDILVGGIVMDINLQDDTKVNELLFFYLINTAHCYGLKQAIWQALYEKVGKDHLWRSATPYFLKDSITFLHDICGFQNLTYPDSRSRNHALNSFKTMDYLPQKISNQALIMFEKKAIAS